MFEFPWCIHAVFIILKAGSGCFHDVFILGAVLNIWVSSFILSLQFSLSLHVEVLFRPQRVVMFWSTPSAPLGCRCLYMQAPPMAPSAPPVGPETFSNGVSPSSSSMYADGGAMYFWFGCYAEMHEKYTPKKPPIFRHTNTYKHYACNVFCCTLSGQMTPRFGVRQNYDGWHERCKVVLQALWPPVRLLSKQQTVNVLGTQRQAEFFQSFVACHDVPQTSSGLR